jgi:alpha-galactosidase
VAPLAFWILESKKRIKRNIIRVAKEKKRIEAQVHSQPDAMDFQQLMARLNYAQDLLNELMQHYQESVKREKITRDEADEEAEFMELLTVIL